MEYFRITELLVKYYLLGLTFSTFRSHIQYGNNKNMLENPN